MTRSLKNSTGFSAVEGLLILIVLAVIGFAGWYVWHASQTKATKTISNTPASDSTDVSAPDANNVNSFTGKVLLTVDLSGEQKTIGERLKSFYDGYSAAGSITNIQKRHITLDKLANEYLTPDIQKVNTSSGHIAGSFNCQQYSPTLAVQTPLVAGNSATVAVLPVDLVDSYVEKPYTISLVRINSKWMIDNIHCPA